MLFGLNPATECRVFLFTFFRLLAFFSSTFPPPPPLLSSSSTPSSSTPRRLSPNRKTTNKKIVGPGPSQAKDERRLGSFFEE